MYMYTGSTLNRRTQLLLDDELHRRLREIAAQRGISMGALIREAIDEKLSRARGPHTGGGEQAPSLAAELDLIALRCAALPLRDARSEEEILGYDEHGLPR
jgi:antitoxin VapB